MIIKLISYYEKMFFNNLFSNLLIFFKKSLQKNIKFASIRFRFDPN